MGAQVMVLSVKSINLLPNRAGDFVVAHQCRFCRNKQDRSFEVTLANGRIGSACRMVGEVGDEIVRRKGHVQV